MMYIWLIIVILLTLVEFMTVNLTTIWFVISGLVALLISFTGLNFMFQFGVFTVLGIILLVTTREWLESKLIKNKEKTNLDRVVGMSGVVTESITKKNPGEVKVDGKRWTAISDKAIKKDSYVKVLSIEGVKLVVEEDKDGTI